MVQRLFEWETSFFCQYIFSLILMPQLPTIKEIDSVSKSV